MDLRAAWLLERKCRLSLSALSPLAANERPKIRSSTCFRKKPSTPSGPCSSLAEGAAG